MNIKTSILLTIAIVSTLVVFLFVDPIPQWPEYHDFADSRTLFRIANAHNVLSNIGLVVVGVWGVAFVLGESGGATVSDLRVPYLTFFAGLILTGFGSSYYHLDPGSQTLIWDRLPMTIMFMGLFASLIGEFFGARTARRSLLPLLLVGAGSVAWWAWTESIGAGDLRMYALVQFLPPVLLIYMVFAYPAPKHFTPYLAAMLGLYVVAKLGEEFDAEIYASLGMTSGHALKHLVSAAASGSILLMLYRRRSLNDSGASTA